MFYRYRDLTDEGKVDSLINRTHGASNIKSRTDDATDYTGVNYAVDFTDDSQHQTSNELHK